MKKVNSASDLAINGAEPAFTEPLHVGRPSITDRKLFLDYVEGILDRHWYTNNGPLLQAFEKQIADKQGVKHCVATCSGTIALEIAVRALQLEGEVIVPSHTFIATAHALHWQGLTPVFADIDPLSHNLDPVAVRRMITPRTTGIIGVHLWGRVAPVRALQTIADEFNLALLFDAAHAFGCTHEGTKVGNFGRCEILSFHATKFFHTFEGGAVLTNDDELAEKIRLMRNFGFSGVDNVVLPGTNGKMTEISAAMGLTNLHTIDSVIKHNRHIYHAYQSALADIPMLKLVEFDERESNNYQYIVLEIDEGAQLTRDRLLEVLHAENVLARRYFWPGCHRMQPYIQHNPVENRLLSNSERIANKVIVMPTGAQMDDEKVTTLASILRVLLRAG